MEHGRKRCPLHAFRRREEARHDEYSGDGFLARLFRRRFRRWEKGFPRPPGVRAEEAVNGPLALHPSRFSRCASVLYRAGRLRPALVVHGRLVRDRLDRRHFPDCLPKADRRGWFSAALNNRKGRLGLPFLKFPLRIPRTRISAGLRPSCGRPSQFPL